MSSRLSTWRVPDDLLATPDPVLYLEGLFGPTLAESFGLRLMEPPVDWLPRLPEEYRKRSVALTTLREARSLTEPTFVKPPNDKSFPARVYTGADMPEGYDEESPVLIAEVVTWEKEFRCFVLDREPRTLSVYVREGELQRENGFKATDAELAEAESSGPCSQTNGSNCRDRQFSMSASYPVGDGRSSSRMQLGVRGFMGATPNECWKFCGTPPYEHEKTKIRYCDEQSVNVGV